jgi:hypothetical protein
MHLLQLMLTSLLAAEDLMKKNALRRRRWFLHSSSGCFLLHLIWRYASGHPWQAAAAEAISRWRCASCGGRPRNRQALASRDDRG